MRRVLILTSTVFSLFLTGFLAGCAYKPDVQQGNTFDESMISQLKPGMTQQQVIYVMGTPLLKDLFHKNRWDYVYTYAKGHALPERKLVTLYFEDSVLSKIDDSEKNKIILK